MKKDKRELLTAAKPALCSSVPAVTFAELPAQKKMLRNVPATLHIGSASLDIYSGCGTTENAGGASAPMLNDFTGVDKVYIACGYTDLRK